MHYISKQDHKKELLNSFLWNGYILGFLKVHIVKSVDHINCKINVLLTVSYQQLVSLCSSVSSPQMG